MPLPAHLADTPGWVEIAGLGWLLEMRAPNGGVDFWWWHDCPNVPDGQSLRALRRIDCSTGERHAIVGGSLAGGDLTIHGGTGSIPCPEGCGLHGWVREGRWVAAQVAYGDSKLVEGGPDGPECDNCRGSRWWVGFRVGDIEDGDEAGVAFVEVRPLPMARCADCGWSQRLDDEQREPRQRRLFPTPSRRHRR